jgi:excisionase family DNA binding protein
MPAKTKRQRRKPASAAPLRTPEVLDVKMTAALLTVSPDLVYELFAKGELPGRKVGRKWITTKAAVLRWIENTSAEDALTRAIERGDKDAITEALNTGKVRVASKPP